MTAPDPDSLHTNLKAFTMLWKEKEPQFIAYFNEQYANRVGEFVCKSAYATMKVKFL